DLQHETADLLHRPETLRWSVLDLARAAFAVTAFWLLVRGLAPGALGWWPAGFALALSSIGGAISLLPGGVGASEASVAGLLILLGVGAGPAGAAALTQRLLQTGMALGLGLAAYLVVRRRFDLGGLFQVTRRQPRRIAA
ncbi:MAG TPA: lysylphosphatidylglycerol synthase domain-containing protein, partial [Candidatus Dormibacteraeota bacterium]|nr:lysylphosphatidylglycerol synthase domain-containing protein [Candidatus Dormibacteraeota bacterium]